MSVNWSEQATGLGLIAGLQAHVIARCFYDVAIVTVLRRNPSIEIAAFHAMFVNQLELLLCITPSIVVTTNLMHYVVPPILQIIMT